MQQIRSPLFIIILLVYLVAGGLYATLTPAWQTPDEPAHYNYVRYLATQGELPELVSDCYNQPYLNELTTRRFPPDLPVANVCYEFHQPPLYYLLQTPLFLLSGGSLLVLRLFSVTLGLGVVTLAFFIGRTVFPDWSAIAYGTMAFVAFIPMHVALLASVNNDALAELIFAAILLLLTRRLMGRHRSLVIGHSSAAMTTLPTEPATGYGQKPAHSMQSVQSPIPNTQNPKPKPQYPNHTLNLRIGLGLITKMTIYIAIPLVAIALWLATGQNDKRRNWPKLSKRLGLIYGLALLIALPWYIRNAALYGNLDIFGRLRHDAVVVGQRRTTDFIAEAGGLTYLSSFITTTFHSFWGQFGWMAVPMDGRTYQLLAILTLLAIGFWIYDSGFTILDLRFTNPQSPIPNPQRHALLLMVAAVGLMLLGYISYNVTFLQFQGRYLFPALIPLGVLFTVGLSVAFSAKWQWFLVADLGGGLLWVGVTSVLNGGLDKWGILWVGLAMGISLGRIVLTPYWPIPSDWLMILCYGGLALLTLLSPFWFVIPYL